MLDEKRIPNADDTIRDLRDWLKIWIDKSRQERGDEFDIEGALRIADQHTLMHVTHILRSEYRAELQRKYAADPNRCIYCGNDLTAYPGVGRYCDICTDKFQDYEPDEREAEDEAEY